MEAAAAIVLAFIVLLGALLWGGGRRPARTGDTAVHAAIERVRSGERGVRLSLDEAAADPRLVSRFNAAVAALEGRAARPPADAAALRLFDLLREPGAGAGALAAPTFVAVLEADRFGILRERIGYTLANSLMATLAQRLATALPAAQIGRIGRTTIEFAFAAADPAAAAAALEAAAAALAERTVVDGLPFDLAVKIGFTDAGGGSIHDRLIDQAAAALRAAQTRRSAVQFADPDILAEQSLAGVELMRRLPHALAAGELHLAYQPKFDARARTVPAVEALVRWTSPELGAIAPDRFVAVAEETGAIRDLTDWVLDRALADQAAMAAAGHDIAVYVNVSGVLLPDREFAASAMARLAGARGRIAFEITETAVIADPEATLDNLAAFSAAGIRLAIDDYGSGLSSLSYLKRLPADELKIDQQFVSGLTTTNRDPLLVRSSIDLAHALEMRVTAEGVDDPLAFALLGVMGCDMLQGYLISHPLPLDALIAFLSDDAALGRIGGGGDALPAPAPARRRRAKEG